jgi:hypothetical protein
MEINKYEPNGPQSRRQNETTQNTPIRPIINWRNAPAYELAKYLTKTLHTCLHLPNIYNIQNSIHLPQTYNS